QFLHRFVERPCLLRYFFRARATRTRCRLNRKTAPRSGAVARLRSISYVLAPCSLKYLTAPGCHGIDEFAMTWFSTVMCTATRSAAAALPNDLRFRARFCVFRYASPHLLAVFSPPWAAS